MFNRICVRVFKADFEFSSFPATINMFARSKNLAALCFSLFLLICVLVGLNSTCFGKGRQLCNPAVLYRPIVNQTAVENVPNLKLLNDHKQFVRCRTSTDRLSDMNEINNVQTTRKENNRKVEIANIVGRIDNISLEDSLNCSKKEVTLSRTALPVTGLVSFPGSGNTWTRHLIQQMTGLGTSSMYCDRKLQARGFPYECHHDRNRTIVTKTHEAKNFDLYEKIVLLVRNPYDAVLSYINIAMVGHTGHTPKEILIPATDSLFQHALKWYVKMINNTVGNFTGPVHVVQYERLQSDMASELRKLALFFCLSVADKDINCTVKLQEGNFRRKTSEEKHLEILYAIYTKEKLSQLREAARYSEKL